MAEREKILDQLQALAEYYRETVSTERAKVYLRGLASLDDEQLADVVESWILQSPFFPKVADLLKLAKQRRLQELRQHGDSGFSLGWYGNLRLNAYFAGRLAEARLDADRLYLQFERQVQIHPPDCACRLCRGEISAAELEAEYAQA